MIIEIHEVSKSFNGKKILDNFSLNIEDEHSYVVTGKEECGKTTLMRMILRLEMPDSGHVGLLGDYKYPFINAGVVFQDDRLVPGLNAVDNIYMVSNKIFRETITEDLLKFLPTEVLKLPARRLSKEQRRIVEIVRACSIPSDVLIMDEPFKGVSESARQALIPYIREKQGKGPLVIFTGNTAGLDFMRKIEL